MAKEFNCDMRGMLSFLVLFLLSRKPMSGQDLADELEKRKGCRPSPGTIYPALKVLKNAQLIGEEKKGKEIVYTLTKDGKEALEEAKDKFCQIFVGIIP